MRDGNQSRRKNKFKSLKIDLGSYPALVKELGKYTQRKLKLEIVKISSQ